MRTVIQVIQVGVPIARVELIDHNTVRMVNQHSKLALREEPMLLMEFHGSPTGVREQAETVQAVRNLAATAAVDGGVIRVGVRCGTVLDPVVLRSYGIGAAHMAWSWVTSEAITVDAEGRVLWQSHPAESAPATTTSAPAADDFDVLRERLRRETTGSGRFRLQVWRDAQAHARGASLQLQLVQRSQKGLERAAGQR